MGLEEGLSSPKIFQKMKFKLDQKNLHHFYLEIVVARDQDLHSMQKYKQLELIYPSKQQVSCLILDDRDFQGTIFFEIIRYYDIKKIGIISNMYGPGSPFRALKQRHVSSTRTGPLI